MFDSTISLPAAFISMIVSLAVSIIGVWKNKYWFVILSVILMIPFSYYMYADVPANVLYTALPFFQIGSAAAVYEKNKLWAWLLLLPALLVSLWMIIAWWYLFTISTSLPVYVSTSLPICFLRSSNALLHQTNPLTR